MSKNRKQRANEYQNNFGNIPLGFEDRINFLFDKYNLDNHPEKVEQILETRQRIIMNLQYYDLDIVSLYEIPISHQRPRYRIITRKNFHIEAISNPNFVHVYQPDAAETHAYMKRLTDDGLYALNGLIYTPVNVEYYAYFKTPSYFNCEDTILAEIGLKRPSINNPPKDADNVGKHYMDGYNANVWLDDSTVNRLVVEKYYSILPRVEIKLRYLNCVYNKQQAKKISERKDFNKASTPLIYLDSRGELTNYELTKNICTK